MVSSLVVSALDSGSSSLGLSAGWIHCIVFLRHFTVTDSVSLHPGVPGVQMGTGKFNAGG